MVQLDIVSVADSDIDASEESKSHASSSSLPSRFVVRLTCLASLGGCLFGYDMGAISGALPQLASSYDLSNSQQEWVVSILYLGGGFGACLGGALCDRYGRQRTIVVIDGIFLVGAIWLMCIADSYISILLGRFVVGIAVAVSGVADISYLHEIAPLEWRGSIVSVNEACISLGFLLAYIAGFVHSAEATNNEGWRYIFGWAGVLGIIQGIGMFNMPESPIWLEGQGRIEESRAAWEAIHGEDTTIISNNYVTCNTPPLSERKSHSTGNQKSTIKMLQEKEFEDPDHFVDATIPSNVKKDVEIYQLAPSRTQRDFHSFESLEFMDEPTEDEGGRNQRYITACPSKLYTTSRTNSHHSHLFAWKLDFMAWIHSMIISVRRYRQQCWIALFLAVIQQLCGQTIVLNYAPYIFAQVSALSFDEFENDDDDGDDNNNNNDDTNQDTDATAIVVWSTLAIGGVKLLMTLLVIWKIEAVGRRTLLLAGMTLISIGLLALIVTFGGIDQNAESWSQGHLSSSTLALCGVLAVVCGYSMSFGPLTWLLTSELFPAEIRGKALGMSTIVTYICACFVTRTFLSASSSWGSSKVFGIYCTLTLIGIPFVYLAIPDTGGKTTDEIETDLSRMYWWRYNASELIQAEYAQQQQQQQQQQQLQKKHQLKEFKEQRNSEEMDTLPSDMELSSSSQHLDMLT